MNVEKLFRAIGGADDELLERSEQKAKKIHWVRWGIGAACLIIAACAAFILFNQSGGDTVQNSPPAIVVNDTTYIMSSSCSAISVCPDGFEYEGTIDAKATDDKYLIGRSYYTNQEIPEWIYVYCEVWDSQNNGSMAYVRFVAKDIRNSDFIRYNGRVYVSMWGDWFSKDASYLEKYDDMQERYGIRIETDIPENGVLIGTACFEETDRIPQTQLGVDNADYDGAKVFADTNDDQVLYVGTSWYTATAEEGRETLHTGYDIFMLYD